MVRALRQPPSVTDILQGCGLLQQRLRLRLDSRSGSGQATGVSLRCMPSSRQPSVPKQTSSLHMTPSPRVPWEVCFLHDIIGNLSWKDGPHTFLGSGEPAHAPLVPDSKACPHPTASVLQGLDAPGARRGRCCTCRRCCSRRPCRRSPPRQSGPQCCCPPAHSCCARAARLRQPPRPGVRDL